MNRRELMSVAGSAVFVAAASTAYAEDDHAGHMAMAMPMSPAPQSLIDAAYNCVKSGQTCLNHSLSNLATGETMLANCARMTDQMIVGCAALAKLATVGSAHLHDAARLAMALCEDCEKECNKHAEMHQACKACAESCAITIQECRKLLG